MINAPDLIRILFVMVLCTVALMITERSLGALFSTYAVQSALLAAIALLLFFETAEVPLLLMAILTAGSKVVAMPFMLRRVQKDIYTRRDLDFSYLSPISSIIISAGLIFVVYRSFSDFLVDLSPDHQLFLGAVIGISLVLMGMLIIFSRRQMVTKIVGYLTMENGVLLFSMFIAEMPFIIEVLIILDLIILTLLSTILVFGIDSSMKEFHRKLDPFSFWRKE
ncbi:MAG: hydrogenase subunit [Dehalococcoidales bacterium]|nr:hydrogenase subunit [Dehalococcoidales bacterium]